MRRFAGLLAFAVFAAALPARATDLPRPSQERVILHTIAGDLVLVLYPDVAPKTVEQLLRLVRAGVYDTTAFVRIEPGFVAQLSTAADRTVPLTPAQQRLIHKLPAEFSSLKHVRGTLSMAREDNDINSAETSFSILLGSAPHLDGKYTIFGRLESGYQVLDEMLKVPRNGNKPTVRLEVTKAEVAPTDALFAKMKLAPAKPIPFVAPAVAFVAAPAAAPTAAVAADSTPDDSPRVPVAGGILLIILVGLASFFLQGRVPPPVHQSLNLVMVLIGMFLFLVVAAPIGQHHGLLAIALFFGLLGVLKVLGKFEMAVEKKK